MIESLEIMSQQILKLKTFILARVGVDSRTLGHCMTARWTSAMEERKSRARGFNNYLRRLALCVAAISLTRYPNVIPVHDLINY